MTRHSRSGGISSLIQVVVGLIVHIFLVVFRLTVVHWGRMLMLMALDVVHGGQVSLN